MLGFMLVSNWAEREKNDNISSIIFLFEYVFKDDGRFLFDSNEKDESMTIGALYEIQSLEWWAWLNNIERVL